MSNCCVLQRWGENGREDFGICDAFLLTMGSRSYQKAEVFTDTLDFFFWILLVFSDAPMGFKSRLGAQGNNFLFENESWVVCFIDILIFIQNIGDNQFRRLRVLFLWQPIDQLISFFLFPKLHLRLPPNFWWAGTVPTTFCRSSSNCSTASFIFSCIHFSCSASRLIINNSEIKS